MQFIVKIFFNICRSVNMILSRIFLKLDYFILLGATQKDHAAENLWIESNKTDAKMRTLQEK